MREMDALNRSLVAGDYTADEHADAVENLMVRHGGKRVIVKTFPNGLQRVGIVSADGVLIATYTEAQPR